VYTNFSPLVLVYPNFKLKLPPLDTSFCNVLITSYLFSGDLLARLYFNLIIFNHIKLPITLNISQNTCTCNCLHKEADYQVEIQKESKEYIYLL
jgi:hypothetical protein